MALREHLVQQKQCWQAGVTQRLIYGTNISECEGDPGVAVYGTLVGWSEEPYCPLIAKLMTCRAK